MSMDNGSPGQPAQMTSSAPWMGTRMGPGIPGQIQTGQAPPPGMGMPGTEQMAPYMGVPQTGQAPPPQQSFTGIPGQIQGVANMAGQMYHPYTGMPQQRPDPSRLGQAPPDPRMGPGWNMRQLHPAVQAALLPMMGAGTYAGSSPAATNYNGQTQPVNPYARTS